MLSEDSSFVINAQGTQITHHTVDDMTDAATGDVALDIHDEDDTTEQDGLIGGASSSSSSSSLTTESPESPNLHYPYHSQYDDLSCIPELPCAHAYTKVGKLYKCNTDAGLCGGDTLFIGACWPMMLLTQSLIWGITLFVLYLYGAYVHWLFTAVGVINMVVTGYSLAKTSCTNPGIIERHEKAPQTNWRWSERGQTYYPPGRGITYCSESQVLVSDYDHFCPWTGTTIAGGNMKWFTIFVSSLSILCVVVIFITILGSAALAMTEVNFKP